MAYASPMKIANGLVLDFTVDNADTAADTFLGLNANGEVTKFASVPRARVSGGGNITESTSSVLTITGGNAAVLTSGLTIQVLQAGAAQSGYLSTTDWNTFNNKLGTSLTSAYIYVGNGSNVATGVAVSGDVTITNTGNVQIVGGAIIDADINASAAITLSKLAAVTASRVLGSDGSGFIQALDTATYPSLAELAYVKGVTSAIQTQLNNRLSVTLSSPTNGDVITYNGAAWVNSPSSTGVPTGGTTAQILRKIDNTNYNTEWHTLVAADITDVSSTAAELNKLSGVTTTATQFNFLNTLSGDVQAQLAAKISTSLTQNYMIVGDASNIAVPLAPGTNGYVLTSVSGVPTWVSPGVGGTVTSVAASGGTTGLSFTGSPITTSGTLTLTGTLAIANGGTGLTALGTANQLLRVNAGATALEYFSAFALSGITAATGTNTIDNAAFAQNWQWNSLTSGTGLLLSSSSTAAASSSQTVFRVNQTGANASSSQTTYSGYFSNTKTGTSSTNVAVFATASGGTTNRAININQGDIYVGGNGSLSFFGTGGITFRNNGITLTSSSVSQMAWGMSGPGVNEVSITYNILSSVAASGTSRHFYIGGGSNGLFAPTSGSGNLTHYEYGATVNQTGGASGTFTGFAMNPVLTSAYKVYGFRHNPTVTTVTTDHWAFYADAGSYGMAASGYFNWGTTAGTSGYGFRDNSGTMEFKNLGGAWGQFVGGSTGATDNAILRADGTGGIALQSSAVSIDDQGNLSLGTDSNTTRSISSTGSDPNINLQLQSKGTGNVRLYANATDVAFSGAGTQKISFLNLSTGTFSGTDATGATGKNLILKGGDALSGVFKGGDISILGGTPFGGGGNATIQIGSATDNIKLGVSSTVGYVWTASDTLGTGGWAVSGGGIGGSTGATDNSVLRADGTGGATLQNSGLIIDDSANLTLGVAALAGGTRTFGVDGSAPDIGLTIYTKGAGTLEIGGGNASLTRINHGDAATSTATRMLSLTKRTSGTAAAGFGLNQTWDIESGSGNLATAVGFTATWSVATDALETSSYVLATRKAGASFDAFSINGDNMALLSGVPANWQSMERGIYLPNRTVAPTTGIANGVALFAEDVNASSEFFVMSESGAKVNVSGLLESVLLSGTTLTLSEAHRGKIIYCTSGSSITITIPASLQQGFNCIILQDGTGTVSLNASAVTLVGKTSTTAQYDTITLALYKATDNYLGK